jgi:hypothetical protein
MTRNETSQAVPQAPPAHPYLLVSLAALAVILLVLLDKGMRRWSFLPVLVGLLGVTLRWRITPLLLIMELAGQLLITEPRSRSMLPSALTRGFSLADWLLCGAVLAFCIAQYRMPATKQGSPRPVSSLEISGLVLSLPIWAFLAQVCWRLVPADIRASGLTPNAWHGLILIWLLGVGVLIVAGALSYASRRRLSVREARLLLQDAYWQETSREQRRLNSWLAWVRLRRRRKEKQ